MFWRLLFLTVFLFSFQVQAKNIATFKKKGSTKVQNISLKEVQIAYQVIKQTTLNTPGPEQFIKDYVRYKVAVEEAYGDKTLVKSENLKKMIVDAGLRESFDQVLYKALAEKEMRPRLDKINKETKSLSKESLKNFYKKNPYYVIEYIYIATNFSPTSDQIKTIEKRSQSIYSKVKKSSKPFKDLIKDFSDNPSVGLGSVYHSKSSLFPTIYQAVQKLKIGEITKPIRTPNGFYIVKLKQEVGFKKADMDDVRNQYFSQRRSKVFNNYFNKLQSMYDVSIDKSMIGSI